MTTERERNRAAHPEFTSALDFLRGKGIKIDNAWIEDAEGVVIAGRRPPGEMDRVWIDADRPAQLARDFPPSNNPPRRLK